MIFLNSILAIVILAFSSIRSIMNIQKRKGKSVKELSSIRIWLYSHLGNTKAGKAWGKMKEWYKGWKQNLSFDKLWNPSRIQDEGKKRRRIREWTVALGLILICTLLSFGLFHWEPEASANIALVYALGMIATTIYTTGFIYGIVVAICGVICINYFFSYPYFEPNFVLSGYPVTFLVMLIIFMLTSTVMSTVKKQSNMLFEREKLLMEAEKEKMRANLLRAVSHDIRTPLTGIIGASSSFLENENSLTDIEKRELVQHVKEDANWLLHMVENLLSVTRINSQTAHVNKSLELVEEVVSEAVRQVKKRKPEAEITVSVPDEVLMIMMDAILIQQVIINLLENAIFHSASPKPIELNVYKKENGVSFHVVDYGVGIPPERLNALFDGNSEGPTQRIDGSKGMGIGLAICETIVLAHGGKLIVRNHSQGAEFVFSLP